jgi:hypothetical protein
MAAEEQNFRRVLQQGLQSLLALDQRQGAQILPIEVEKIEGVIAKPVGPASRQVGMKGRKVRLAAWSGDDGLTVDDEAVREIGDRIGDRLELFCPVIAAPRQRARLSITKVKLRPVAVELDLVNPARTFRRLCPKRG